MNQCLPPLQHTPPYQKSLRHTKNCLTATKIAPLPITVTEKEFFKGGGDHCSPMPLFIQTHKALGFAKRVRAMIATQTLEHTCDLSPDYQPINQVEVPLLAHESRLNKFKKSLSDSPSINLTQVPNKQDPENFSNFKVGLAVEEVTMVVLTATTIVMVASVLVLAVVAMAAEDKVLVDLQIFNAKCYKYGHTTSVCHYRFDGNPQPNSSLVL